jgi:ATP-dependent Clp protease ATP-binding subunit ClpC
MQEAKFWPQCFASGARGHIHTIMELTDRAWMIVQKAQEEARALGDRYVGTDHLLLAMLRDGESAGAWVLDDLQVSYDDVFDRMVTTA